ncbi:hypothetical protein [Motiliproteus coralliicola]|uniref:hypothetical protein n=1 Tax=Motiliproteus coralliicola TaxID=2283196 RepID=UPI001059152E|nr:hypothetical protein [Motiliproteus coralliicola]
MRKQFVLNLDAAVVIAVLFAVTLGFNALQYSFNVELTSENQRLQWQGLEDKLNLDSLSGALESHRAELKACQAPDEHG